MADAILKQLRLERMEHSLKTCRAMGAETCDGNSEIFDLAAFANSRLKFYSSRRLLFPDDEVYFREVFGLTDDAKYERATKFFYKMYPNHDPSKPGYNAAANRSRIKSSTKIMTEAIAFCNVKVDARVARALKTQVKNNAQIVRDLIPRANNQGKRRSSRVSKKQATEMMIGAQILERIGSPKTMNGNHRTQYMRNKGGP